MENPPESDDLSEAEKVAIDFADRFATNHLSIDDQVYDSLRIYFSEAQIVELGASVAFYVGFGRLASTWDFDENLPDHLANNRKGTLHRGAGSQ